MKRAASLIVLVFLAVSGTFAQSSGLAPADRAPAEGVLKSVSFVPGLENPFPDALFAPNRNPGGGVSFVPTMEEVMSETAVREKALPVILNNHIVAFYGKPGARNMGILGQYAINDLMPILDRYAKEYDAANGERGVVRAFYLIYGTCWPGGEIGYLKNDVVMQYIEYAQKHNMLVFIDHQIGKYTVDQAVEKILPFMKYSNVHAAIDPEWRTLNPMKEIGSITAAELNRGQQILDNYLKDNGIPERKIMVVHQFHPKMIANRPDVRADFERVQLIHCADGFGNPALKKLTYRQNALAENIPLKSFKLFLKPTIAGAGWDQPLLGPKEVLALTPEPFIIMYQ